MRFKEFMRKVSSMKVPLENWIYLCEHDKYEKIPGTKKWVRMDPGNTNTKTMDHGHVYAKPKGKGQIYSVNTDGTGHDGTHQLRISDAEADFFRRKGFKIDPSNIIEQLEINLDQADQYQFYILVEED